MILGLPFARHFLTQSKAVALPKYFMRRLTRLEPPYIVALIMFSALYAIAKPLLLPTYFPHALASLFYLHNLIYGKMSPANGVSWTLEIEIQFYFLAPLLTQVFRVPNKLLRRTILLIAIIIFSATQHVALMDPRAGLSLLAYLQYFLGGLLIADIYILDLQKMNLPVLWDLAALGVFLFAGFSREGAFMTQMRLPVGFTVLVLAAFRGRVFRKIMATQWIAIIGGMCYSIYLLHDMIIPAIFRQSQRLLIFHDFGLNLLVQWLCLLPPTLFLASLYFVFIERPCMDPSWPSELWSRITRNSKAQIEILDSAE
jgi:peptidoglycan/LPS O-acetylase OafA/YrhL